MERQFEVAKHTAVRNQLLLDDQEKLIENERRHARMWQVRMWGEDASGPTRHFAKCGR